MDTPLSLLLDLEKGFPDHYKEYYGAKRNNLFASIQAAPRLWSAFMLLDKIWLREFQDMRTAIDTSRMFPMLLFMNAHSKIRIGFELGFSCCLHEAQSIFRDAIESAAHAHRVFFDPELQKLWVSKNDDADSLKAFNTEFWHCKEERLFEGLPELYQRWKQYSEWGSHTNPVSIVSKFVMHETDKHLDWRLNYTGVEPRTLVTALFVLLIDFSLMEKVLFKDCSERLKFDHELLTMRLEFESEKERLRKAIIDEFKIPAPNMAVSHSKT
jgi:hypothetical protein